MANHLLRQLAGFRVQHGYALLPCMQIAAYTFISASFVPSLFGWYRKVYSGRREADVLMSSVTGVYTNYGQPVRWRYYNNYHCLRSGAGLFHLDSDLEPQYWSREDLTLRA
jgi:hypothetical protein